MKRLLNIFKWIFFKALPKQPVLLLAFPFVVLIRMIRPFILVRLIPVYERIGHALQNTEVYLLERRAGLDRVKSIDIFYPDRPWKCNQQVIKMWKRILPLHGWAYWIAKANLDFPGAERHHYIPSHHDRDINGLSNDTPPPVSFTVQEEDQGSKLLRDMGIAPGSSIICFHARDTAYMNALLPGGDWSYHNYRDVDIDNFVPAVKNLLGQGHYLIRMGSVVNKPFAFKHPHLIDYPMSPWRSDFADMYLISRCHFYIGTCCGLDGVAMFFRKHMVIVNMIPIKFILAWSPNYLYIIKKLWLKKEKRLMTFKEMLSSEAGGALFTEIYNRLDIEVVENTPEEIEDASFEMEQRLKGVWQTNEEYEQLQERFWALFKPDDLNGAFHARVGSRFLMQNKDLLE